MQGKSVIRKISKVMVMIQLMLYFN